MRAHRGIVLRLPIDELLARLVAELQQSNAAVVEAEPGAGKTTRVPWALAQAFGKEVWVLEPRRLAARLAATFVAQSLGEKVGEQVGYQVRFDERTGPSTCLKFITDALLLRFVAQDPQLSRAKVIVFDEFHERHLALDIGLALVRRLQKTSRPDLKVVVMSATLDTAPIKRFMDDCPVLSVKGRPHEVVVHHAERADERPLQIQVATAVGKALREQVEGDILVFLPGAGEIRRAMEACASLGKEHNLAVVPLYGDLPFEEQERAVRPGQRRKVILSTNVAETSLTIEGVRVVIDAGLAREAGHNAWSGLPTLRVRPISRAAAIQRAGRAGRLGPGVAYRLYTKHDFALRPPFETPEVKRADLAEAVLLLATLRVTDPREFSWFEAPGHDALTAAQSLLKQLLAMDDTGAVTPLGKEMLRLPLHPRQARIALAAKDLGLLEQGATLAALLGERDLRGQRAPAQYTGDSDLLALLELYENASRGNERARALGVNLGALHAVKRARDQVARLLRSRNTQTPIPTDTESALCQAILQGYTDRVAQRASRGSADELLLAGGGRARLAEESVVRKATWLVAVDAGESGGGGARRLPMVRLASAIEPDWLIGLPGLKDEENIEWNADMERVEATSRLSYESLILEESRTIHMNDEVAAPVLAQAALNKGVRHFVDAEALDTLQMRVAFLRGTAPELAFGELDDNGLLPLLTQAAVGCRTFRELRELDLLGSLYTSLSAEQRDKLERWAPTTLTIAHGRKLKVHYERGKPPWAESYLQDFFGQVEGPRLAGGRVAVTLHLLAPNRRAVQVTSDLVGFWERHYPALRRELGRKYPRHAWPEDPKSAVPPPPRARR